MRNATLVLSSILCAAMSIAAIADVTIKGQGQSSDITVKGNGSDVTVTENGVSVQPGSQQSVVLPGGTLAPLATGQVAAPALQWSALEGSVSKVDQQAKMLTLRIK